MDFETFSSRNAEIVLSGERFKREYEELLGCLRDIQDKDVIQAFEAMQRKAKSISEPLNKLIKQSLVAKSWEPESPLFTDANYKEDKVWRLDFAKGFISVEVAFNHGEAVAWNLLKPVLASEYNHVNKAIQTEIGIVICATREMKEAGGFDNAVADFEKFKSYLIPLQAYLTTPILLIGLKKPETFKISHKKSKNSKNVGSITLI
jgi:hypothetical protein